MKKTIYLPVLGVMAVLTFALCGSSCSSNTSYAGLLDTERRAVNAYLANYRVIDGIPEDSVFEYGEDAPYYCIDGENRSVYMKVINPGDRTKHKVTDDQMIYFRFMRQSLNDLYNSGTATWDGNAQDVITTKPLSFRYNNFTLASSAQYGTGIQMPLAFLGIDCEVELIIKSQYGYTSEISNVVPYLYKIHYYESKV